MTRAFLRALWLVVIPGMLTVVVAQESGPQRGYIDGEKDWGYENWPGRDGSIKRSIDLPVASFGGYGLLFASSSGDSTLNFKVPYEDGTLQIGWLQIAIYRTIAEAQRALVEYQYTIQRPGGLPRLTASDSTVGDVAFGREVNGRFAVLFTRANVWFYVHGPTATTKELTGKLDKIIQDAPVWKLGDPRPTFIISEEFRQAFLQEAPVTLVAESGVTEAARRQNLSQNCPNPFNTWTGIGYVLPRSVNVSLKVYDLRGQEVTTLVEGHQAAGQHQVRWNGRDRDGRPVASAVYCYWLGAGEFEAAMRMTLVR